MTAQAVGSAPPSPRYGSIFYNTNDNKYRLFDGERWLTKEECKDPAFLKLFEPFETVNAYRRHSPTQGLKFKSSPCGYKEIVEMKECENEGCNAFDTAKEGNCNATFLMPEICTDHQGKEDEAVEGDSPSYNIGDLVKHRASGKKAVVVSVEHVCAAHPPLAICAFRRDKTDCNLVPAGRYTLSYDFDEEESGVDGLILEKGGKNGS